MFPLQAAVTVFLISLCFPCMVETQEGACSKTKRFEFVEKGFALLNHEIKSVKVAASLDCAMECAASSKCKSFNFNLSESVQNNCHLNDATRSTSSPSDYKESSGLTYYEATRLGCLSSPCKNLARCLQSCSGDTSFKCDCVHDKTYGDRCEFWTADAIGDFSLLFPLNDTSNFVTFAGNIQPLETFTICLWLQTTAKDKLSLFSYGATCYFQCSDTGKCVIAIQGTESEFYIPPINDGHWHQLCLSRKYANDSLNLIVDGLKGVPGNNAVNLSRMFMGGSQLVLGQKTVPGKGFDGSSSFKGNISHFNIWGRWRNVSGDFVSALHNCSSGEFGDQLDWRLLQLKSGLHGDVRVSSPDTCSSNSSALNELYSVHFKRNKVRVNITTTIPQELLKFTICVWIYPPRYETDGNIVSFSQNDTLVYFRILFKNTKLLFKMNEETVSSILFPLMDDRSHFICSLSDGAAGRFEVMVDGKVSSSDELPRGNFIPAESTLFLGSIVSGKRAILGRIGGLNIWGTVLEKHTIVALYRGNGREIGNVLSWFDLKDSIPEEFLPFTEALNLEEQHKEQESDFTLHFSTRSTQNVANITWFKIDIIKFTACAWFKTKEQGAVFQYMPDEKSSKANSFLVMITSDGNLDFKFGEDKLNTTSLHLTDDQWHHVCLKWRKGDGLTDIYIDGELSSNITDVKTSYGMNVSGDFIIGQYFDESTKSFTLGKSFVGKITEVNIWGMFLNLDTIVTMSRDCSSSRGDILSWSSFRDGFHGDVQLIETSECLVPDFTVLSRRDDRCNEKYKIYSKSCSGAMKALFDRVNTTSGRMWRCYSESALGRDSINGGHIFNQTSGKQECITDAHNYLLTIT